jgi:RelB Antitoxin alpha helical domain
VLNLRKSYVLDENQKAIAVQIPIEEFEQIEEILENYGLVSLMSENEESERLSGDEALNYYQVLKNTHVDS